MKARKAMSISKQLPDVSQRKDIARVLGVSVSTVIRFEDRGELTGFRLTDSSAATVHFTRECVRDFLVKLSE